MVRTPASERSPRLVLRFALYSALALLLAGFAILWFVRHGAQTTAERAVLEHAQLTAGDVAHHVSATDLAKPFGAKGRASLDLLFEDELAVGALRIKLWNTEGVLVYSSEHDLIGARTVEADQLRRALGGDAVLETGRLNEGGGSGPDTEVVKARVPVTLQGTDRPAAVLEIERDRSPVARQVRDAVTPVAAALGLALLLLYGALFPILRQVTKALEHRNRRLTEQATELEGTLAERREAVASLHEVETRARTLVEQLPLVTYIDALDDNSSSIYMSPQIEPILGYSPEEWVADAELFPKLLHPDDRERVLAEHRRAFAEGRSFSTEYRLVARDGRVVWFQDEVMIVRDANGNPLHAQGFLLDVTERRRAAEAVRESEERFRTLVDNVPGVVFRCAIDEHWTMEFLSDAIEEISGYPPSDFLGNAVRSFTSIVHTDDREPLARAVGEAVRDGRAYTTEYRILARDGSVYWVLEQGQPVAGPDGTLRLHGAIFDVTERKLDAQERAKLAAIVESSDDGIISADLDGLIVSWNAGAERIYGYTPDEVLGQPISLLAPDDRAGEPLSLLALAREGEGTSQHEVLRKRKDGTLFEASLTISPLRDEGGWMVGASAITRDITARKEAEEALRESEAKFRAFVETTEEWVWAADREGTTTYSNPAVERILGFSVDEVVGMSALAFMHEDDRAVFEAKLPVLVAEKKGWSGLVIRRVHRDGSIRQLESNATPILSPEGEVLGWRGSDRDVTESARAADQLERRNAELLALHETSLGLIQRLEADSVLEAVAARAGELLGTSHAYVYLADRESEELRVRIGTGVFESFVGYRLARGDGIAGLVWETGEPKAVADYGTWAGKRPDFDPVRVRAVAGVPLRSQSDVVGVLGLAHVGDDDRVFGAAELELLERFGHLASLALDNARLYTEAQDELRERRRAEDALVEAEARYRTLVEQLPLVTYIRALEVDGANIYVSPQIQKLLGYAVREWHQSSTLWAEVVHPDDRDRVMKEAARVRRTGKPLRSEYRCVTKKGDTVWVLDETHLIRDENGKPLWAQGYLLDVTARKVSEAERERLLGEAEEARGALTEQNERLRELDRLKDEFIALVSHELRTPLTSIRGYVELLLDGEAGPLSEEQLQFLSIVDRNSHRLLHLVGDLLFLAQIEAGKLALETEAVDLAAVASESVEAARPLAEEKGIRLTLATGPVPLLAGDGGRLAQLLDNLISNGIKFTPEGGRVDVRVRTLKKRAVVEVRDSGLGIPKQEQERLFERFFRSSTATERAIPGTGLGLAISKAIVEAHGGTMAVASEEGAGTTMRVSLPVVQARPGAAEIEQVAL